VTSFVADEKPLENRSSSRLLLLPTAQVVPMDRDRSGSCASFDCSVVQEQTSVRQE
jgi:hypothetical protein